MKKEAILEFFFYNGKQYSKNDNIIFDNIKSNCIYEVVRLIKGIPLFIEDHIKRMRGSAKVLGYSIEKSDDEIFNEILKLSKANKCGDMNVKLICCNLDKKQQSFLTYFIQSNYPEKEVFNKGVDTILYNSERINPNAKIVNSNLRENVNVAISLENVFEGLLVNQDGYITEGSRSNVFFVKDNMIYTAHPAKVLIGVTRMRIMEICKSQNIQIIEKAIHQDKINIMDGAFITATSINVLPIKRIEAKSFDSVNNEIIQKISRQYLEIVNKYIEDK